jgi:hypothetical protein
VRSDLSSTLRREYNHDAIRNLEPVLLGVSIAVIEHKKPLRRLGRGEFCCSAFFLRTKKSTAEMLVFEFAGNTFSLVSAHMGWQYEYNDLLVIGRMCTGPSRVY